MPINPTEQQFCQLMEADPIVRRDLIREWKALPPQVVAQLEDISFLKSI